MVETHPIGRDASVLAKRELDEDWFCRVPYGGTSDSGAADTVAPEELFGDYPLEPSPGSISNMWYVGAGGQRIQNKGQRTILVMSKEKKLKWMTVQVAAVKKMLISASKNNDCNNEVIYRKSGSYIRDERTGDVLSLRRSRGTYVLDLWVVPHQMGETGLVRYKDQQVVSRAARVENISNSSRHS